MFAILQFAGMACAENFSLRSTNSAARVVMVEDPAATFAFQANAGRVRAMVDRGILAFTGKTNVSTAWHSLVTPGDVVGIKVFSEAGPICGTRPAVVAAVVQGLIAAKIPTNHIIIWDKHEDDLRAAGYFTLAKQLGVRAAGSAESSYDPTNFYNPDTAIIGNLVWGDFEFGRKGDGVGRKSFISLLVSRQITKIISIAPLLNDNYAGVTGHLMSVALGSVDNTFRFQKDPERLSVAVPEIYALSSIGDRVALNITDALIGQYEGGGERGLLQYSEVPNQLWFSRDPVALDTLALKELERRRHEIGEPEYKPDLDLYANAALLQLGINDPARIQSEKIK